MVTFVNEFKEAKGVKDKGIFIEKTNRTLQKKEERVSLTEKKDSIPLSAPGTEGDL